MAKSMPASLRGEWCAAGLGKFKFSRGLVHAKSQSILMDDKLQLYHKFTRNGDAPLGNRSFQSEKGLKDRPWDGMAEIL